MTIADQSAIVSTGEQQVCNSGPIKHLACPICHQSLLLDPSCSQQPCAGCGRIFRKRDGIWDLRTRFETETGSWNAEQFDRCYRATGGYLDGFEHASCSGIPAFAEEYRIERVKDRLAKAIDSERPNRLLDVGCGNGWYGIRLREKWNFQGEIHGIDVSPFQISLFQKIIDDRGIRNTFPHCANSESLPFEDAYFDTVVMTEVLEHVASPLDTLRECARVLQPGGRLCLSTPSGPICRFWIVLLRPLQLLKRLFVPSRTDATLQIYDNPMSYREIRALLQELPLQVEKYEKSVLLPHESYLQFVPEPLLRTMVSTARVLESVRPLLLLMGLHHIITLRKLE